MKKHLDKHDIRPIVDALETIERDLVTALMLRDDSYSRVCMQYAVADIRDIIDDLQSEDYNFMFAVYWVKPQKQIKEYHGSYDTFEQAMQSIRDWWQENGQSFTIDYGLYNCFYEIEFESNEPTEEE